MNKEKELAPAKSGLIVHDGLPEGHPYRLHLEKALRAALGDLPGAWDVSLVPVGRRLFNLEVVAPDASRWSAAVPVPEGPRAEAVAEMVRAACGRRCPARTPSGPPPVAETGRPTAPHAAAAPSRNALMEPAATGRGSH